MEGTRGKDDENRDLRREFDDLFEERLKEKIPHHRAYEEAEKAFQSKYNHNKYSSFESYRISRSARFKNRKKR